MIYNLLSATKQFIIFIALKTLKNPVYIFRK